MTDLLFIAAALLLQEPAQIRVTTRMVEVGVLVHDRKGRPVIGLRAQDFRLTDGGRAEEIRTFAAAGTERRSAPGETHVATAILLDYLNSVFSNESLGRVQLLRFLKSMEPNQPVALLSLDMGFQVLHDFTTDSASLVQALERFRPYRPIQAAAFSPGRSIGRRSRYQPGTGPGAAGEITSGKLDGMASAYYAAMRARQTDSAMAALAAFLARTPGRKNLLWLSSVFPWSLAASLRNDDVAVYPIDLTCPIKPSHSAVMLAERTGGVAFDHGNDLLTGMRSALQDGEAVYLLGYYPSHGEWNGRFRRIEVTVARPDLEVRNRLGYVAALEDHFQAPDQRQTLWDVAAFPAEARGIAVEAKAKALQKGEVEITLAFDGRQLPGHAPAGPAEEFEVMAVPVTAQGELLDADVFTVKAALSGAYLTAARRIKPVSETPKLRIVVRRTHTGALGSATVPVGRGHASAAGGRDFLSSWQVHSGAEVQ